MSNLDLIITPRDDIETEVLSVLPLGPVLFQGPPGTGKSYLARKIADSLGVPAYIIRCHPDMLWGEMMLSYAPTASGLWAPCYKPVLQSWGHGPAATPGLLIFDDLHVMGPGGMAGLYVALEAQHGADITIDDGTRLAAPSTGSYVIGTMNGTCQLLDEPVMDRLWSIYNVLTPASAAYDRLLESIRPLAKLDYDGRTVKPSATFREWLAISERMKAGLSVGRAVYGALGCHMERTSAMLENMVDYEITGAKDALAALVDTMHDGNGGA